MLIDKSRHPLDFALIKNALYGNNFYQTFAQKIQIFFAIYHAKLKSFEAELKKNFIFLEKMQKFINIKTTYWEESKKIKTMHMLQEKLIETNMAEYLLQK